jgi:MFS family permease
MSIPSSMTAPAPAPLRLPVFRRLATTYTLNELAWAFGTVALAVLVYDRVGSALATMALFVATTFVPALLAPALTARLDRVALRRALPALYLIECALFTALAVVSAHFWLPLVIALALLDGVVAITGRALTRAAVAAALRPSGALAAGNRLLNMLFSVAYATGPALAGLVVARAGISVSVAAAGGLFLVMAVMLLASRDLPGAAEGDALWRERLGEGLRYVREHRGVRRVLGAHVAMVVAGSAVLPVEVVFVKASLGADGGAYGLLLTAWGAGAVLSSIGLTRAKTTRTLGLIPLAAAATGAGYLIMAGSPSLALALAGALVGGAGNGVCYVSVVQALQEQISDDFQARVMGALESANAAGYGAGFLLGGGLAALTDARVAIAASGVGMLVAAGAVATLTRRPRAERESAAAPVAAPRTARPEPAA